MICILEMFLFSFLVFSNGFAYELREGECSSLYREV
jgi:hypothetical protein